MAALSISYNIHPIWVSHYNVMGDDGNAPCDAITEKDCLHILNSSDRRVKRLLRKYNPLTGEYAPGERIKVVIADYMDGKELYVPKEIFSDHNFCAIVNCGSISGYIQTYMPDADYDKARETVFRHITRQRCKHDFYFFAFAYGRISNKDGGPDIPFYLRPAQRKLVKVFEEMRLTGSPIRVILLKCRQWGGSTCTDIYMGWIQIFWQTNWNSNIVGHQSTSATQVFDMYEKLINSIPLWLFYDIGENYSAVESKLKGSGSTQNIKYLIPRKCKIQTGSALSPESTRSAAAAMCHLTEEAFFPETTKYTPAQVVKAAISGIKPAPYTFIVRESTPNGRENGYHDEWVRATTFDKDGRRKSSYMPVFVAWHEIETYILPFKSKKEKIEFAMWLWDNRLNEENNGTYFWWLFEIKKASLEAIHWYITKAKDYPTYPNLDDMKQEYPSDDIEAFLYSGVVCFDPYTLERMEREDCEDPVFMGDIEGDSHSALAPECMDNLRLVRSTSLAAPFRIWEMPETEEDVANQYLVSMDIGGAYRTSDYYDIVVFNRYDCMYGGVPTVAAEWHGHLDPDQAAMKAAQIARFYNNAFLVVENNTAYSKMNKTDGDISELFFPILIPLYDNIYNSNHSKLLKKKPKETRWGFSTTRSSKTAIVKNLQDIVRDRAYYEHEKDAVHEYSYFMFYDKNGTYGAVAGKHDDRVMARAIGLYVERFEMDPPFVRLAKSPEEIARELERKRAHAARPVEVAGIG